MGEWELRELSEITELITDGSHFSPETVEDGYSYVTVRNVDDSGNIDLLGSKKITKTDYDKLSKANCKPEVHDILFSKDGTVGKVALVDFNEPFVVLSSLAIIRPNKKLISPKFLWYMFLSPNIQNEAIGLKTGAAIKRVVLRTIKTLAFPTPPLEEQKLIISKLDALFGRINRAIALAEENIQAMEELMGSVLDEEFGELNCKRSKLKSISENIQYGYTGKTKDNGKYYYLRITDIQNGEVDWRNTPFSDISEEEAPKYLLSKGDIVFARTGATAGKSYLFDDDENSVFASYLIRVVCNREILYPNYLYWYFQSHDYWQQIFGGIVGAAQPNFNGTKLGKLKIPVPDINKQKNLAKKFSSYDKIIRKALTQKREKLESLKSLKSSLLDQAFKGELV